MAEQIFVVRHGATEWSKSGQHTSRTDLPLLEEGREQAAEVGEKLAGVQFDLVLCSPLLRARETCRLAGFADVAEICEDLKEWDYGEYEGLTTPQIRETAPDWWLWRDGCPGGETPPQIGARVDRVLERFAALDGNGVAFAHGHVLRVFTARWVEMEVAAGARFKLEAGSMGLLAYERETQVLDRWSV
ncbi:MAG TPA: histidine phosphatase family protein [Solirubrobacteraceae bacterium]|jgi:probable phosphoglycerate mutase|nr:histidine phosphatase family protein [Solirubrobacteraceae bacterium]